MLSQQCESARWIMNRGIVTQLVILLVIVARAAADTISIEPKILARRQVCLVQQFDAHVSEFDGRRFLVHIGLTGCGGNRKVPASCSPYVVPRDSDPEPHKKLTATNDEV